MTFIGLCILILAVCVSDETPQFSDGVFVWLTLFGGLALLSDIRRIVK
jgi:hypothetical protein